MLELVQSPITTLPPYVVPIKNSRWEEFAQAYLQSDTPTEAARAIGVKDESANSEARRYLSIPEVKARIAYLEEEARRKALITEGAITEELAIIAFSNPLDYITASLVTDPNVISVKPGVDPKQLRAIAEIEVRDTAAGTRSVKFKLHSKTAALQMAIQLKGYGAANKVNNVETSPANKDKNGKDEKESPEDILKGLGLKVA